MGIGITVKYSGNGNERTGMGGKGNEKLIPAHL
jgi:hypothetical protein